MVYLTRRSDRTIFFSSHHLGDVERVADYVAVLDRSVLPAACSLERFRTSVREVRMRFAGPPPPVPELPGLLQVLRSEGELRLSCVHYNGETEKALRSLNPLEFGAILGWLQIRSESHRDLWAFLVHRPISRTRILASKVAAGMVLYALGAGLPLVVLVAVARTPGNVAAPFEWSMALPVLANFLGGIACYLAGLLTGLRRVRWYASRTIASNRCGGGLH
jgi:hypothetical protein